MSAVLTRAEAGLCVLVVVLGVASVALGALGRWLLAAGTRS